MSKPANNDAIRVISMTGIRKMQELWLNDFHSSKAETKNGNAERWFNVVLDYLSMRGDEIIPGALRDQEERIINLNKSKEYLAALAEVVQTSPRHNEYDQTVLVLTASVEERAEALRKVLEVP